MQRLIWRWKHQNDHEDVDDVQNARQNSVHHPLGVGVDLFDIRGSTSPSRRVKEWILPYREPVFTFGHVLRGANQACYPEIGVECVTEPGKPRLVALERGIAYFCPEERVPLEGIGFTLTLARLREYLGDAPAPAALAGFLDERRKPIVKQFRSTAAMERAALEIRRPPPAGAARHFFLQSKLLEILAEICLAFEDEDMRMERVLGVERRRLLEVREVLETSPLSPVDMIALATQVGTTPRRLNEAFKQEYGMTILEWLEDARFRHAAELLRRGMPVKKVAGVLGYTHPDNFSTGFRRRFGLAPGAWRTGIRHAAPPKNER
ncbi:MAG: AraC family transcriptional regulator [Acidobacteriaceae bacterium]|nr:AraC family transcriptional regulator [Acidobacteriaceae bacterium]